MEKRPIETAPATGDFLAYNQVTGWYRTRREGGEFPYRRWGGCEGVWYPRPSHWRPLPDSPDRIPEGQDRNGLGAEP